MTLPARRQPAWSASFAATAQEHLDDVYAYLVYLTRDRSLAEDLAADTFEKALRLWRRFDPRRASARTWLCQIARTTALDWFRAEERRQRREERAAAPERVDVVFGQGLAPDLEAGLAALSAVVMAIVVAIARRLGYGRRTPGGLPPAPIAGEGQG